MFIKTILILLLIQQTIGMILYIKDNTFYEDIMFWCNPIYMIVILILKLYEFIKTKINTVKFYFFGYMIINFPRLKIQRAMTGKNIKKFIKMIPLIYEAKESFITFDIKYNKDFFNEYIEITTLKEWKELKAKEDFYRKEEGREIQEKYTKKD